MTQSPFDARKKIMSDDQLKDIVFLVGENEDPVPAFKQMLAVSNPVFKEMLYGKFKHENQIKIPDFKPDDFKQFLNYMYFQEIDLKQSNPLNIYEIAHKYMVQSLLELCSDKIYKDISYDNVFLALEWLNTYENDKISRRVLEFFSENTIGCLKVNPGYKGLSQTSLVKLLKIKELRCSEVLLYENLLIWANRQLLDQKKQANLENKKKILEGLLQFIQLRINEDLSFDPIFTTSRCIWKSSLTVDYNNLQTSSKSRWYMKHKSDEKKVCYGIKMILSNLTSHLNLVEWFDFMIIDSSSVRKKFIESFKIPVRDAMGIKDIYFENPFVMETEAKLYIEFKNIRERLVLVQKDFENDSNYNQKRFSLKKVLSLPDVTVKVEMVLLTEPFCPNLHSIFTKKIRV